MQGLTKTIAECSGFVKEDSSWAGIAVFCSEYLGSWGCNHTQWYAMRYAPVLTKYEPRETCQPEETSSCSQNTCWGATPKFVLLFWFIYGFGVSPCSYIKKIRICSYHPHSTEVTLQSDVYNGPPVLEKQKPRISKCFNQDELAIPTHWLHPKGVVLRFLISKFPVQVDHAESEQIKLEYFFN